MLAGHYALAAIVKSRQPQLPLWALMLATGLLDLIFIPLYFLGEENIVAREDISIIPQGAGYGNREALFLDWSHSLVGALGISLLVAIVTMFFWGRRNAVVLGAVVFSHWVLDFLVFGAELAILPGNANDLPRVGLGLGEWPWVVFAIELALVLLGAYLYYHAAMRSAIRAEREETRGSGVLPGYNEPERAPTTNYRQQALITALALFALLLATLIADLLLPFNTLIFPG